MLEKDFSMREGKTLYDILSERAKVNGVWDEEYRSVILKQIMLRYKTEIIREYVITDMIMNGDKVMVKWTKRFMPLTDEKLLSEYGRDIKEEKL